MSDLPKTIKRWCCQGKSCGNTELHLVEFDREAGAPLYDYVRGNDNSYIGWQTEQGMRAWLEATKDDLNPE